VESGAGKTEDAKGMTRDWVQAGLYGLALQEQTGAAVTTVGLDYTRNGGKQLRVLDADLRATVAAAVDGARNVLRAESPPPPVNDGRCFSCKYEGKYQRP
jgi:CRISPR/Cas system-associated exonuclease Cas4 (RecB family)